jgi:starch synthase
MNIYHISAECYPAAKAGGLGDVVGALPKYLNRKNHRASVILPKYKTDWIIEQKTEQIFKGSGPYGSKSFTFTIEKIIGVDLGFDLYVVNIPGKFDREGVYIDPWSGHAYWDEMDRFFSFQIASLEWLVQLSEKPDIVHCHDHHTSLVPFMIQQCYRYDKLAEIPTIVTIHNGEYQGRYDLFHYQKLPAFNLNAIGLLDWDGSLNSLAAGIKCAWRVTTVSEGYMKELMKYCHGLELLLRQESQKTAGLINGIDEEVWDPETDPYLKKNYSIRYRKSGKRANKEYLCSEFELDPERPLFSFIGRLVREKGADLLPKLIEQSMAEDLDLCIMILGTGDPSLHKIFNQLRGKYVGYFDTRLEYNEELAHIIYGASDFLLMPSRVEPCGLNQMYAMRYGTIPVVRATGGLADTVIDLSEKNGYGFLFDNFDADEAMESIRRAVDYYNKGKQFAEKTKEVMQLDFSWGKASEEYVKMYQQLTLKSG